MENILRESIDNVTESWSAFKRHKEAICYGHQHREIKYIMHRKEVILGNGYIAIGDSQVGDKENVYTIYDIL